MSASPERKPRIRRSAQERIAWLDAEIERVRTREERRLVKVARRAGYFEHRFTSAQIAGMVEVALRDGSPGASSLSKLRARADRIRSRQRKSSRAEDARRKAILGAFLVAQFRHKPDMLALLRADIEEHLRSHRSASVAAANLTFITGLLDRLAEGDAASPDGHPDEEPDVTPAAVRARRQILLGAWLLDRRGSVPALDGLVREELEWFLLQDRRAGRRNARLLADVIGTGRPDGTTHVEIENGE